jgi:adenosylhomocysteinase
LGRLAEISEEPPRTVREFVQEYKVEGRRVFVLGEGRLINLAAAEGHPAAVMDMSFANQALAAEFMVQKGRDLDAAVHRTPEVIDREIARLKLESMETAIDQLTEEQRKYLSSWDLGT